MGILTVCSQQGNPVLKRARDVGRCPSTGISSSWGVPKREMMQVHPFPNAFG